MLLQSIQFLQKYSSFNFRNRFQILGNRLISSQTNFQNKDSMATVKATPEQRRKYMLYYNEMVDFLVNERIPSDVDFFREKYRKLLEYNKERDWEIRGIMVVTAYKNFADEKDLTEGNLKLANILGLCVGMLHAVPIITDDLCDGTEFRSNLPCWHKYDGNELDTINHAFLLNGGINYILEKYFSDNQFYPRMLEVFNKTLTRLYIGQSLDSLGIKNGKPQLDLFTFKRFVALGRHKAGYCIYYPPVLLASYLADKYNKAFHEQAERVINLLGVLYKVKNDMMEVVDSPFHGKNCTDISGGICTWPVVTALQKATPAQRKIIEENYGKPGRLAETAIRNLYEELEMVKLYHEFEKSWLIKIHELIGELRDEKERNVLYNLWNM